MLDLAIVVVRPEAMDTPHTKVGLSPIVVADQ